MLINFNRRKAFHLFLAFWKRKKSLRTLGFDRTKKRRGDAVGLSAISSPNRSGSPCRGEKTPPTTQKIAPLPIVAEGRCRSQPKSATTFSLPPVFPKKTALLSARTLGTRNHDTHQLQDRSIRRTSSTVSPVAEHKAGCLDRISRIYRMTYRDSTFSTTFSISGYFTSTSSTQYSSVLPA